LLRYASQVRSDVARARISENISAVDYLNVTQIYSSNPFDVVVITVHPKVSFCEKPLHVFELLANGI